MAGIASVLPPFVFLMHLKRKGIWPPGRCSGPAISHWPVYSAGGIAMAYLSGRRPQYTILPMIFMFTVTSWALVNLSLPLCNHCSIYQAEFFLQRYSALRYAGFALGLSLLLIMEAAGVILESSGAIYRTRRNMELPGILGFYA